MLSCTSSSERHWRRRFLSLVVVTAFGCAEDGRDAVITDDAEPDTVAVDYESQVQPIFDAHCSCHLSLSAPQGAVLLAGVSYNSLVNRTSVEDSELLLVQPGVPERSFLLIKVDDALAESTGLRRGARMPLDAPPLSAADIDTIRRWIAEGAERSVEGDEGTLDTSAPVFDGAISAQALGPTEIELFWGSAVDDRSAPDELLYFVYVAEIEGGQDFSAPTQITPAGSTSTVVADLEPETTYYCVVRAVDEAGNVDDNVAEVSVDTAAPPNRFPRLPLVEERCSSCHGIRIVFEDGDTGEITPPGRGVRFFAPGTFLDADVRTTAEWEAVVTRMRVARGAPVTVQDAATIVEYFGTHFVPATEGDGEP